MMIVVTLAYVRVQRERFFFFLCVCGGDEKTKTATHIKKRNKRIEASEMREEFCVKRESREVAQHIAFVHCDGEREKMRLRAATTALQFLRAGCFSPARVKHTNADVPSLIFFFSGLFSLSLPLSVNN